MNNIGRKNKKPLPTEQILAAKETQRIANGYFNFSKENKELIKKIEISKKENEELKRTISAIESARAYKIVHRIASNTLYEKISICLRKKGKQT